MKKIRTEKEIKIYAFVSHQTPPPTEGQVSFRETDGHHSFFNLFIMVCFFNFQNTKEGKIGSGYGI